jgi:UTRA domain
MPNRDRKSTPQTTQILPPGAYDAIVEMVRDGGAQAPDDIIVRRFARESNVDAVIVRGVADRLFRRACAEIKRAEREGSQEPRERRNIVQINAKTLELREPKGPQGRLAPGLKVRQLEHKVVPTTPLIRSRLRPDAATVLMVEQVAEYDDEPLFVRTGYHDVEDPLRMSRLIKAVGADDAPAPISGSFELFFGVAYGTSESSVQAVRCEEKTAQLLGLLPGTPVMFHEIRLLDVTGRARSLSFTHYHSEGASLADW